MMYYNYHMFTPFMFLGPLFSIIFWVVVAVVIMKVIKHKKGWKAWDNEAVNILRERFAKGEISKEEYEERLKVLEK